MTRRINDSDDEMKDGNGNTVDFNGQQQEQYLSALAGVWEQYQMELRIHSKINNLRRDRKLIMEQMKECDATEQESISILRQLVRKHSALEERLRPKMKLLLWSMECIETRIVRISERGDAMTVNEAFMKKQFERQYNFYA